MLSHTKKCPDCGSRHLMLWAGGRMGVIYECKDCGYHGPIIVDEDVEN